MNHDYIMGKVMAAQLVLSQATNHLPHNMKMAANDAHFAMNRLLNALVDDRDKPRGRKKRKKQLGAGGEAKP